jgi:hypothetical protein
MANPTQTTELEAVNLMLASIGERPVNNIGTTQRLDVVRAEATLNEVNVQVQTRGWWFNCELEVTLSASVEGEYIIDKDIIKVDASNELTWQFAVRGSKLYDRATNLFTGHTEDLLVNYVRLLDYDDLPQSARLYIARRAGVIYQTRTVGSPTLFEFTNRDAQEAYGALQQEELEHDDVNITYAPGIRDVVYRR